MTKEVTLDHFITDVHTKRCRNNSYCFLRRWSEWYWCILVMQVCMVHFINRKKLMTQIHLKKKYSKREIIHIFFQSLLQSHSSIKVPILYFNSSWKMSFSEHLKNWNFWLKKINSDINAFCLIQNLCWIETLMGLEINYASLEWYQNREVEIYHVYYK